MELSPDELLRKMRQRQELPNVIAVFGEEDYFRSQIAAAIPEYVFHETEAADREITVFEKDTNLKELEGAINSYPFFCGSSLIILRDEKIWGAKQESENKKQQLEKLALLLDDVPDYCTVFINAVKLDKRSKLYKSLKSNALVCECKSIKPYNLAPWLDMQAKALGGQLDNEAVGTIMEYLAPVDSAPLQLLRRELEKLSIYAGDRKNWTKEDVEEIFSALPEASGFALLNAIAEKKLTEVLNLLAGERKKGTNILQLCGFILFQLRRLTVIKELQQHGYSQAQIASQAGMIPFVVKKMTAQCLNFSMAALNEAVLDIAALNIELRKGGRQYARLEEILVKLLS